MDELAGFNKRVDRGVRLVVEMINDHRHDEATLFLFNLHKSHEHEWLAVRQRLFSVCWPGPSLLVLSTILNCSCSPKLSYCTHLVSGLDRFVPQSEGTELFD